MYLKIKHMLRCCYSEGFICCLFFFSRCLCLTWEERHGSPTTGAWWQRWRCLGNTMLSWCVTLTPKERELFLKVHYFLCVSVFSAFIWGSTETSALECVSFSHFCHWREGDIPLSFIVDQENRTAWINEKVNLAKTQFMDGINIDIEQVVAEGSPEYHALTALVKETTEAFHREIPGSQVRSAVVIFIHLTW